MAVPIPDLLNRAANQIQTWLPPGIDPHVILVVSAVLLVLVVSAILTAVSGSRSGHRHRPRSMLDPRNPVGWNNPASWNNQNNPNNPNSWLNPNNQTGSQAKHRRHHQ